MILLGESAAKAGTTAPARSSASRRALSFRRVQAMTLREDWPEKREVAQAQVREFVARAEREGGFDAGSD